MQSFLQENDVKGVKVFAFCVLVVMLWVYIRSVWFDWAVVYAFFPRLVLGSSSDSVRILNKKLNVVLVCRECR